MEDFDIVIRSGIHAPLLPADCGKGSRRILLR
jgi:hypothetical protein